MASYAWSFLVYNPFTDDRIAPAAIENLFKYPEIPEGLSDSVIRAKRFFQQPTVVELDAMMVFLDQAIGNGPVYQSTKLDQSNQQHLLSDDVEFLDSYLNGADHHIDKSQWPKYFALLTLAATGEIYNYLWPAGKFLTLWKESTGDIWEQDLSDSRNRYIPSLTACAGKAVAFAERYETAATNISDSVIRKKNRSNAPKAHEKKHAIFEQYIDWSCALPESHSFKTASSAASYFVDNHLSAEHKRLVSASTTRTMNEHLKKYCLKASIPYPFANK